MLLHGNPPNTFVLQKLTDPNNDTGCLCGDCMGDGAGELVGDNSGVGWLVTVWVTA